MSISIEAASQMVAHARAIGDATLERELLRELHATAAHSEEAMPPVLSSDVDDSAIDALHEAVAATPRDPDIRDSACTASLYSDMPTPT